MSIRLTESHLRQVIREEARRMIEMGMPLVSSDAEGSIAEPQIRGLRYQSAAAMRNAETRLLEKLSTTKHPKTGLSYGATIISALRDPKYSMLALKMFNNFANKMGFNTDGQGGKTISWRSYIENGMDRPRVLWDGSFLWIANRI